MLRALAVSVLLIALRPTAAGACACCDGGIERALVGWSQSGRSALVQAHHVGCEDHLAFEIWRPGQSEPVGCFDAYSDAPTRRVECGALTFGYDRFAPNETRPTSSPRAAEYPRAPRQLDPSLLRARLEPVSDAGELPYALVVELRHQGRWHELLRAPLGDTGAPEGGAGEEDLMDLPEDERLGLLMALAVEVRVWPSPRGRRALLQVRGHNTAPTMGFWPDELRWVELPAAGLPTVEGDVPVYAVPGFARSPDSHAMGWHETDDEIRSLIRALNRHGLARHRAGDYVESARWFARAVTMAPSRAVYRYNLACALARLGQAEGALAQLAILADAPASCERCDERMLRARADEDLSSIRARVPRRNAAAETSENETP
ncbi:MAG: tetratricopeptide repeat protein [Myxococcota bacterium]